MTLSPEQRERLILLDRAHGIQELLRGMSHDFRNNLQVIALASQLDDMARTTEIETRVDEALEEMNLLLELLGSLGRVGDDGSPTCALQELVTLLRRLVAYQRNLPSILVGFDDVPRVTVNVPFSVALQILLNLITNAKEATIGQPEVGVGFFYGAGRIEITIDDDGPGLPSDAGEPLCSTRSTRAHGGTGLFAARELAGIYDGSVRWERRVEGGTRVRVSLPATDEVSARY
jgi:two-component system, OmpR family, osmolarity sensor histidine kinase EnvZ